LPIKAERSLVSFDAPGLHFVTHDGKALRVYDVKTGEYVSIPADPGERHAVYKVAIDATAQAVAAQYSGDRLYVWKMSEPEHPLFIDTHFFSSNSSDVVGNELRVGLDLKFSPDGKRLALALQDAVLIFDLADGHSPISLRHRENVEALGWSPDGKQLLTGSHDEIGHLWEIERSREITRFPDERAVTAVSFGSDARGIVTAGASIRLWGLDKADTQLEFGRFVGAQGLSPHGTFVASDLPGFLWISSVDNPQDYKKLKHEGATVGWEDLAFSSDEHTVSLDTDNGTYIWNLQLSKPWYSPLAFKPSLSADGTRVTAERFRAVDVVDVGSGGIAFSCNLPDSIVTHVISPDGKMVASVGHQASFLCTENGTTTLPANGTRASWSENGRLLEIHGDQQIAVFDILSRRIRFSRRSSDLGGIKFGGPDNMFGGTGRIEYGGFVWYSRNGTGDDLVRIPVDFIPDDESFSLDGNFLAVLSQQGYVVIWDLRKGRRISTVELPGHASELAFSRDGKYLIVMGHGVVWRLLWRTEDLLDAACSRLTRNLSRAEVRSLSADPEYAATTCMNLPKNFSRD
jgi:WD40 repeat protein